MLEQMSLKDIEKYWNNQVANRPVVWAVVGDPNRIDMNRLNGFGTVVQLRPKDVMNQSYNL